MWDDLVFLHGNHRPRCVAEVDKRFTYYAVQLMSRGAVWLDASAERREGGADDGVGQVMTGRRMWWCYPGPWFRFHEYPRGRPWDHRYIAFQGPGVESMRDAGLFFDRPVSLDADEAAHHAQRLDRLYELVLSPTRLARLRAINLLEAILLERAERHAAASPDRPAWLASVCEALADFAADEPDYEELAAEHGMAMSTLRRRFREATGVSLHRYRIDCRITAARRLLGESDEPIKRVAFRLGYRDVHYFTRQFSLHAGVPPQTFRRSRQR